MVVTILPVRIESIGANLVTPRTVFTTSDTIITIKEFYK
jgi:hypothetical protein